MNKIIQFPMSQDNKVIPPKAKASEVAENTIGTKYQATKDLDIKEVAKLIRADIKAAIKAGQMPKGKYSVKIDRYSMGQALWVSVADVEFPFLNIDRLWQEVQDGHSFNCSGSRYSEEGSNLLRQAEAIVNAYNYDKGKGIEDYYDQKFYTHINFCSAFEKSEKDRISQNIIRALDAR